MGSMSQAIESPSTVAEKKDIQLKKTWRSVLHQTTQTSGTPQHYCHDQENGQINTVKHRIANYQLDHWDLGPNRYWKR